MQISLKCVRDILISVNKSNNLYDLLSLDYTSEYLAFTIDKLVHGHIIEINNSTVTLAYDGKILLKVLENDFKYSRLSDKLSKFQNINVHLIKLESKYI